MIQDGTMLTVADNSGALRVCCIKVLGGSKRRYARVGDVIRVSVKECKPNGKVKKGDVLLAVIVRTKSAVSSSDQTRIRFDSNAAVILNAQMQPLGTRVFGPVCRKLRGDKFMKIVSLALEVL